MKLEIFKSSYGYYNLRTIDGRPNEEMVNYLKENGYRWSRNNNAWYPATNEAKNKEKNELLVANFQKRFFDPAPQEQKTQELNGQQILENLIDDTLDYEVNKDTVKILAQKIAEDISKERTVYLETLIAELREQQQRDKEKIAKLEQELMNKNNQTVESDIDNIQEQQQIDEEAEWERENTLTDEEEKEIINAAEQKESQKTEIHNEPTEIEITPEELSIAKAVLPTDQYVTTLKLTQGEEGNFFKQKIKDIAEVVKNAPKLYATDGAEQHPIIIRYFHPTGTETLVTEIGKNGEAYGFQCLNGDYEMAEWGSIDLNEVKNISMMEIDYHVKKGMTVERWLYKEQPDMFPQYAKFSELQEEKSSMDIANETGNELFGNQETHTLTNGTQSFEMSFSNKDVETLKKRYAEAKEEIKQNYVLEKLSAAGIEVVTDKEEFDRLLESHNILQKMEISSTEEKNPFFQADEKELKAFAQKVDDWKAGKLASTEVISEFSTSTVLQALSIPANKVSIDQLVLKKINALETEKVGNSYGHDIDLKTIKQIPQFLSDPIMVYNSASRQDSYTVLTDAVDKNNESILIALQINKFEDGIYVNNITSAYGKDENEWFIEQVKLGNLVYQDKKRSLEWANPRRLSLPNQMTTQGSLNVIQKEDIVNKITSNFSINDRKIEFTENQQEFLKSIGFKYSVNSDGKLNKSSFYKEDSKNEKIYLNIKHLENNDITIFVKKNNTDYPIFDNTKKNFFEFSLITIADSEERNFIPLQNLGEVLSDYTLERLVSVENPKIEDKFKDKPDSIFVYDDFKNQIDNISFKNKVSNLPAKYISEDSSGINPIGKELTFKIYKEVLKIAGVPVEDKKHYLLKIQTDNNYEYVHNKAYPRLYEAKWDRKSQSYTDVVELDLSNFDSKTIGNIQYIAANNCNYPNPPAQTMTLSDGKTYGFAYEGKIYLNSDIMKSEVAIHEYTHLWDNYIQRTNPKLWQKGKDIFQNTKFWEDVKADPNYADISDNDDLLLSEVHAKICGKMADVILNKIIERDGELTKDTVINWENEVDDYIYETFESERTLDDGRTIKAKGYGAFGTVVDINAIRTWFAQPMKDLMNSKNISISKEQVVSKEPDKLTSKKDIKANPVFQELTSKGVIKADFENPHKIVTDEKSKTEIEIKQEKNNQQNFISFQYKGNTYIPFRKFKEASGLETYNSEDEWIRITHNLDWKNAILKKDNEDYSVNAFYEAAGGKEKCKADIFYCINNSSFVLPTDGGIAKIDIENVDIDSAAFQYDAEVWYAEQFEKNKHESIKPEQKIESEQLTSKKDIKAIREQCREILQKSDSELTEADKTILAQYEGAGGINEENRTNAGILNEFYTPNNLVEKVWQIVDAYAPNAKTVLEPSAGIGKFANNRTNNEFTMHELDETSARINRILHPEAKIIQGAYQKQFFDEGERFRKTDFVQPKYDVVIGNPPYGTYNDKFKGLGEGKEFDRYEEYFIAKGLEALKDENSIMAFVVPSGFLNTAIDKQKEIISSKGHLIDAYRLPEKTFPTTEVGTDIIIMQNFDKVKKSLKYEEDISKGMAEGVALDELSNGNWFKQHPEKILGKVKTRTNRFGKEEEYVAVHEGLTVQDELNKIDSMLPKIEQEKQVLNKKRERLFVEYSLKHNLSSLNIPAEVIKQLDAVTEQIREYKEHETLPKNQRFTLPNSPMYLKSLGADDTEISLPVSVVKKAFEKHHLSVNEVNRAIIRLYDPVFAFEKKEGENKKPSLLMITDEFHLDNEERIPIVLSLNINDEIKIKHHTAEVQDVRTIFDKTLTAEDGTNLIDFWTKSGFCKYVDEKKISDWNTISRNLFPIEVLQSDKYNILTKSALVNQKRNSNISLNNWEKQNREIKPKTIPVILLRDSKLDSSLLNALKDSYSLYNYVQKNGLYIGFGNELDEYEKTFDKIGIKEGMSVNEAIEQIIKFETNGQKIIDINKARKNAEIYFSYDKFSDLTLESEFDYRERKAKKSRQMSADVNSVSLPDERLQKVLNAIEKEPYYNSHEEERLKIAKEFLNGIDNKDFELLNKTIDYGSGDTNKFKILFEELEHVHLSDDVAQRKIWLSEYANPETVPDYMKFQTWDEALYYAVNQGSPFENDRKRIFEFFKENSDTQERAKFLKNEYGEGGGGQTCYNKYYDAKGFKLDVVINGTEKSKEFSWAEVAKAISTEIMLGKYYQEEIKVAAAFVPEITPSLFKIYPDNPEKVREKTLKFQDAMKTMDFHKLSDFMIWTGEKEEPVKIAARKVFEAQTGKTFPVFNNVDDTERRNLTELWLAKNTNVDHIDSWNKCFDLHSEQDVLEYLVSLGSGTENGKERINEFFEKNSNDNERIKFLINEYNWYGSYRGVFSMECENDSRGIKVEAYITNSETNEVKKFDKMISWKDICNEIKRQRLLKIYLDAKDKVITNEESVQDQPSLTMTDNAKQAEQIAKNYQSENLTGKKSIKPKKEKWNINKSKGEVMTAEEFSRLYGRDFDEREFPIWAATDWQGNIELNKLTDKQYQYMVENENYIQKDIGQWTHKVLFASGNIYAKIEEQKKLLEKAQGSEISKIFEHNIEVLESSKKTIIDIEHIHLSLKSTLAEEFTITHFDENGDDVQLNLQESFILWATNQTLATQTWRGNIDFASANITREELGSEITFNDIVDYIDGTPVKADPVRSWKTYDMDELEIKALKAEKKKQADLKRQERSDVANKIFDRYLHEGLDSETAKRLETEYNRRFNSYVSPDYSKLPLFVDGMSAYKGDSKFKLYDQQIKGISFLCNKGNGLPAYDVGVGKTATGIVATENQIQLNRSKRPIVIVPNRVYGKWYTDIKQLFPKVKVNDLYNSNKKSVSNYIDKKNPHKLIIPENTITLVTYEALKHITFTDESCENELYEDFSNLLSEEMDGSKRENAQSSDKIKGTIGAASQVKDENYFFFEDCGFDNITVDEAHNFKNLWTIPRPKKKGESNEYAGIPSGRPSARALKLYAMTQLVQRHNNDRNVFLLTATPFVNSPTEVYSMLSYMARKRLHESGIHSLRDFMNEFCETKMEFSVSPNGNVETRQVMKNWKELPALQNLLTEFIDKVDGEEAGIIRSVKFTHVKQLDMSELQKKMREIDEQRMAEIKEGNSAAIIVAMNNMRLACVAPALCNPDMYPGLELPPLSQLVETSPKLKFICDTFIDLYKKNPDKGQYMYVPLGKDSHGIIKDYLVKHGVPKEAVEIINGEVNNTQEKQDKITEKFNNPEDKLKIIIGGKNTCEGIDLNGNSMDMANCSLGWNPNEAIQAEGRVWRQGNLQGNVHAIYPVMNDSIDSVLYQKHDEKRSRINELWNYKGDKLNVEDINPEDLKFDLIKDPNKKAKLILQDATKEIKAELSVVNLKIKSFEEIIESRKQLPLNFGKLENNVEHYQNQIQRYKDSKLEIPAWLKVEYKNAKKECEKTERQKTSIEAKLAALNISTPEEEMQYIHKLNLQKHECEDKIKNIEQGLPELLKKLEVERMEQKLLEYPIDKQREILEADILNNLRPMEEVEPEIRTERFEKMIAEKLKAGDITQEEHDLYKAAGYKQYEKWMDGEIESLEEQQTEKPILTAQQKPIETALDHQAVNPAVSEKPEVNKKGYVDKAAADMLKKDNGGLFFDLNEEEMFVHSPEHGYGGSEMTFAEQVDAVLAGTYDRFNALKVSDTPQILLDVGCRQLPILYTQVHLRNAMHEKSPDNDNYHGLSAEQIKKIPELLKKPAILMDSLSSNNKEAIIAVLNAVDNDNAPLFATIKPNGFGTYEYELINSNFMLSVYGKDNGFAKYIENAVNQDKILFWNKKESQDLFSVLQLQLPQGLNNLDSNKIIHQSNSLVNPNIISEAEQLYFNFDNDDVYLTPEQLTKSEQKRDEIIFPVLNGKETGMYKAFNDFAQHGVFDIVGSHVDRDGKTISETGWKQLHAAMNIYRSKEFETLRFVLIDRNNGEILDQLATTSYMPNCCKLDEFNLKNIISRAEETDSIVVAVHNHPSGNVLQSECDIKFTKELEKSLTPVSGGISRFGGHIILDHDTFNLYTPKTGWQMQIDYHNLEKEDKLLNKSFLFTQDEKVFTCKDLVNIALKINDVNNWNDDFIPVVFVNANPNVSGIKLYDKSFFNKDSISIHNELENSALEAAAIRAFPIITEAFMKKQSPVDYYLFEEQMKNHVLSSAFSDAVLPDSIETKTIVEKYGIKPGVEFGFKHQLSSAQRKTDATWKANVNENLFRTTNEIKVADVTMQNAKEMFAQNDKKHKSRAVGMGY